MKKIGLFWGLFSMLLGLGACRSSDDKTMETDYRQITMTEAEELFQLDGTYLIVDVRTVQEYEEGHIPGAICIPNESISDEVPELPDKNQLIYIYCRSGNRSKQAAKKLVDLGYTNIVEFGGIIDWDGEIETGK